MDQPSKLIVEATIPSIDSPDAHVVDSRGLKPIETVAITESIEGVLRSIGQNALVQGYLSIDKVLDRQTFMTHPYGGIPVNKANLLAKPLDRTQTSLAEPYKWSDAPANEPTLDK